jgi:hypothetical protein
MPSLLFGAAELPCRATIITALGQYETNTIGKKIRH